MFAIFAAVLAAIAFVLHIVGATLGTDATGYGYLALTALAVHFITVSYGWRYSTGRTRPRTVA